ncbi:MAG: hypothetical protein PUE97_02665 [Subdoligranulum variabile]|nr:hypothetical protein [Subdoligranulum variabile]
MNWLSLLATAVSGSLGVIGVFVGAYMARKTAVEQQQRTEFYSACSLVLSTYVRWIEEPREYRFALLASIASMQLLCAPDSDIEKSLKKLEKLVMITDHPSQQCGNCLNDFRQKAQNELIKRYGDKRLSDMKKDMGE